MEQKKTLAAMESFLALTKAANSPRAAVDLIRRATSHPLTFIFAGLLEAPTIQSLAHVSEFASHLELLRIFCYGTCRTYREHPAPLPELSDDQALKLRQLSLLTLAGDRRNLAYDVLLSELVLPAPHHQFDERSLEDFAISAMYAGLVQGRLDPLRRFVCLTCLAPLRDLAPGSVKPIIRALDDWSGRCSAALGDIEARIAKVRSDAAARHAKAGESSARMNKLLEDGRARTLAGHDTVRSFSARMVVEEYHMARGRGKRLMEGSLSEDEAMDVDDDGEPAEGEKKRARSRRH